MDAPIDFQNTKRIYIKLSKPGKKVLTGVRDRSIISCIELMKICQKVPDPFHFIDSYRLTS